MDRIQQEAGENFTNMGASYLALLASKYRGDYRERSEGRDKEKIQRYSRKICKGKTNWTLIKQNSRDRLRSWVPAAKDHPSVFAFI